MAKEFTLGLMVRSTMETSFKVAKMDTEFGGASKVISTKVTGATISAGGMVRMNG